MLKETWSLDGPIRLARRHVLGTVHPYYGRLTCTEINPLGLLPDGKGLVEVIWEAIQQECNHEV